QVRCPVRRIAFVVAKDPIFIGPEALLLDVPGAQRARNFTPGPLCDQYQLWRFDDDRRMARTPVYRDRISTIALVDDLRGNRAYDLDSTLACDPSKQVLEFGQADAVKGLVPKSIQDVGGIERLIRIDVDFITLIAKLINFDAFRKDVILVLF